MDMCEHRFFDYAIKFGAYQKRSMFGGIGLFQQEAMYALLTDDCIFIRGGEDLDKILTDLGCEKYRHVKKQTTATVNYYDITQLFEQNYSDLDSIIERAILYSIEQRYFQKSHANRRLRDLPNMQLTLERMVKKAGVEDVDTFMRLGAPEVFNKVRRIYGSDLDVKLLWKFAGAIEGIHWKLLQEPRKRQLLESCHAR
ncbi:TfoX/Sxy family DNA transformation protein [Vibrio sp. Vb2880]|uniref:DNA transformation protein n=1 Tax=Vibrio furnissii TaxID=29494 RepID=A0A0Q2XYP7_VIBFU|nr:MULTISPECIES: TfoX/Sxy family DNA transformation protein [Vibrio]KQH85540.1 DNA transformation protein [Vibrio furnissii]MBO0214064.1 TfoX/Sxy family DNA transformation protein [Vibrio sp. Vb2880]MCG6213188.1 TfoX/Sxy family DNA transformation protein [Vibrio furnissii]MCG6215908.1 TfoX/Sxy family DNA transformation protein [Vibrio furnissii]MCG6229144.1 TfoX/Sxy family DNA transformation protein [Vibrio furnissii]